MSLKQLPATLRKGGSIPKGIAPIYYFNSESTAFVPFQTLQKQPRTLKYSLQFDYRFELESQYPSLKMAALHESNVRSELDELRFPTLPVQDEQDEHYQIMNKIFTPNNLRKTQRIFLPRCWEFGGSAYELDEIPTAGDMTLADSFGEVCVAGQSNAGKSSLVNVLMGSANFHKGYAVVSKKAGRTRMLNFYTLPFHFSLVDLMGYGFALNVEKKIREYWMNFMKKYFTTRLDNHLKHVFLLIDIDFFIKRFKKHPDDNNILSPNDRDMMHFLDDCYVPYSLVLTKIDSLNINEYKETDSGTRIYDRDANNCRHFENILDQLMPVYNKHAMLSPSIHITSARLGFGITELQCMMAYLCQLFERDDVNGLKQLDLSGIMNKLGGEIEIS